MGLKIYWQDVWPEKIPNVARLGMMWEGLVNYGKKVLLPDTELVMGHPEISGMFLQFSYLELLNNRSVVEGVIHAADMEYDGAMIGCYADPGLDEARNMVDIPVTGVCESSIIMGRTVGRKLAVVTVGSGFVPAVERNIRLLGFESMFIANRPVRYFDMTTDDLLDAFEGKGDELIGKFETAARSCVEDGADCVLAGCGWVGPAFTLCGYNEISGTGVRVVDGTAAALKQAEGMADLSVKGYWKKASNTTNAYATPPVKLTTRIRKQFGLVD